VYSILLSSIILLRT